MFYRRKIILNLLDTFGGSLSAKRFQKLLFLVTRGQEKKTFDFLPYRYGCYSFQASFDLHVMENQGLVAILEGSGGNEISLRSLPQEAESLTLFDSSLIDKVKAKFGDLSQDDLIRYTYRNYPFYAIRSILAEHLLTPEELHKVRAQDRHFEEPALFTIGYEGISLERYINQLLLKDVHVLCDVRKNAYSQKYGFSKGVLQKACEGVGIIYVHVPQLGIESDERQDLNTQEDYDRLFETYERTTLKANWDYLLSVRDIIDKKKRVALTCFEANPKQCHRSRVAKALMELPDKYYQLTHITNVAN